MRSFLFSLTDLLDWIAALAAIGAGAFFVLNFGSVETGPEFLQIGLMALVIAVVPYCLAGALHRICSRNP